MPILFAVYCSESGAHELQLTRLDSRRRDHKLLLLISFADAAFIDLQFMRDAAAPFLGSTHLLGLECNQEIPGTKPLFKPKVIDATLQLMFATRWQARNILLFGREEKPITAHHSSVQAEPRLGPGEV